MLYKISPVFLLLFLFFSFFLSFFFANWCVERFLILCQLPFLFPSLVIHAHEAPELASIFFTQGR